MSGTFAQARLLLFLLPLRRSFVYHLLFLKPKTGSWRKRTGEKNPTPLQLVKFIIDEASMDNPGVIF